MKRKWNMPLKNIVRVIEINETIIKNNNETIIPDESKSSSPFKIKKVLDC